MHPLRWLILLAAGAAPAAAATAQTVYFAEDFDGAFPPPGWQAVKANSHAGVGWRRSPDLRAWHDDEFGVGPTRDLLHTRGGAVDLRGAGSAYLHFYNDLAHAQHLANHPSSIGVGINEVGVSTDDWQTRTTVWTETRVVDGEVDTVVDLSAWAGRVIDLRFHYYGDFDQEWWVDDLVVNDDPRPRTPPPTTWAVPALPSAAVAVPLFEDFEAHRGVPPPWMALNATDTGFLPDADAWCSIAGLTHPSASGIRCLEMGLDPASLNMHMVRNACVIGLDGGGATELTLSFEAVDFGEDPHAFDGVWISSDGVTWYPVHAQGDWGADTGVHGVWERREGIRLDRAPVDVGARFYLMFAQEDDWPYAMADGIGVDDVSVQSAPAGPRISLRGHCGSGPVTLDATGLTPWGTAGLAVGPGGAHVVPSGGCAGTVMDTGVTRMRVLLAADGAGHATISGTLPAAACGTMVAQVIDLGSCVPSNVLLL